ncbi:putative trans-sulfuration enzyme [Zancudomyces culisetae]|uniref:Putative trans-sulfuration enzyme n=1 Tax=Zancudomyces culisetae TaxID=1213189 RepID=A0A1R1PY93_ZANCU|nr:putative trans-sulfuration enzyme [Zancudomyces culisetae]|eukprot:OMH85931.1 putative trans-sulfuration enzyme [Zancudomyces culisetae]
MPEIKNPFFETTALSTKAVHADRHLDVHPEVSPAINTSVTYAYSRKDMKAPNYGTDQVYEYARYGTPTLARVESVLSTICGGYAVAYSSGLSALGALLNHYKPRRILMNRGYFGSFNVVQAYLQHHVGSATVLGLDAEFKEGDFVYIETPINPHGEVFDIRYYANRAHAVNALLVVDSTLAPPPLCNPFIQGADVVLHSATKYLGGHADILAGVVVSKCPDLAKALNKERSVSGAVPGNLETWLLLRSLRTLELRVMQQSKTAKMLVAWFHNMAISPIASEEENKIPFGTIVQVRHASIQKVHPAFDVCAQHPNGFGALFTVTLKSREQALAVAKNLRLTTFATSLGDVNSLVDWRHGEDPTTDPRQLRVSVGLENIEDLKNDWRRAIQASCVSSKL